MSKDAMEGTFSAGWEIFRICCEFGIRRLLRLTQTDKGVVATAMLMGLIVPSPGALAEEAKPIELQLPIACTPGKDCFVQNYPDTDTAKAAARDFVCSQATYDGHDGTDIRVLSVRAAEGVKVLAAAAGKIRGMRDGEPDHLMRSQADKAAVKGRECGNGVAIVHDGGWETQYCHLRRGSLRVRSGQQVAAGTELGEVGQSGETQFAHVHITVRHNGKAIDPFTSLPLGQQPATCPAAGGSALWAPDVTTALGAPETVVLETGFSDIAPNSDELELGRANGAALGLGSDAVIFFARIMHLRAGDRVRMRIVFPSGPPLDQTSEPSARDRAIQIFAAARKRTSASWASGRYQGTVEILRASASVAKVEAVADLK